MTVLVQMHHILANAVYLDFADDIAAWTDGQFNQNAAYNLTPTSTTATGAAASSVVQQNGSHPWLNDAYREALTDLRENDSLSNSEKGQKFAAIHSFFRAALDVNTAADQAGAISYLVAGAEGLNGVNIAEYYALHFNPQAIQGSIAYQRAMAGLATNGSFNAIGADTAILGIITQNGVVKLDAAEARAHFGIEIIDDATGTFVRINGGHHGTNPLSVPDAMITQLAVDFMKNDGGAVDMDFTKAYGAAQSLWSNATDAFGKANFNASMSGFLAGIGGSAGDVVELLDAAYLPAKQGFLTGDWSSFGATVLTYGASALASAVVFGAMGAAIYAVSPAAAGLFGFFMLGMGIGEAIFAFSSLAHKIGVDLGWWTDESPLFNMTRDPLIIDLDGDGIELTALGDAATGSQVHFDFDGDGFAERTGWVSPDDAILVHDRNGNGLVDGAAELFGSATVDGFDVLGLIDSNGDGKIDSADQKFAELRVWRDVDSDGQVDAGEMQTLAQVGLTSISLNRTDVNGQNQGHDRGFEATVTKADEATVTAGTIYFQTDRQDTQSHTDPGFTLVEGVEKLPQLPGSGQINSVAWKASTDANFKLAWTALTDASTNLSALELRQQFENLLLDWAEVDDVAAGARGRFVDAQHLAFVEKFFGDTYKELTDTHITANSPSNAALAGRVEASFQQVVNILETVFLSQVARSQLARGATLEAVVDNPYFFYALLDFRSDVPAGQQPPATPGNLGLVLSLIKSMQPTAMGEAVEYYAQALTGLKGMASISFDGNAATFSAFMGGQFSDITNTDLRQIAIDLANGSNVIGTSGVDGLWGNSQSNVLIGGAGVDYAVAGAGHDYVVWSKGDGSDFISNRGATAFDNDVLVLTDVAANEVSYTRNGKTLQISIALTGEVITVVDFFNKEGTAGGGIDRIIFSNGTQVSWQDIASTAVMTGYGNGETILDSSGDDIIWAGEGHNSIVLSGGNDTILWAKGDGWDTIGGDGGELGGSDTLKLSDVKSDEVIFSRVGQALLITVETTGETITDATFFTSFASVSNFEAHANGLDKVIFADGTVFDRNAIIEQTVVRGSDYADSLQASALGDTFIGGKGNDYIDGRGASDTYLWKMGDGSDTINDSLGSGLDTLKLLDVHVNDVLFSYMGDALQISILATGEVITVNGQFQGVGNLKTNGGSQLGMESIEFAGGVTLDRLEIANKTGNDFVGMHWDDQWVMTTTPGPGGGTSHNIHVTDTDEFGNIRSLTFMERINPSTNDLYFELISTLGSEGTDTFFEQDFNNDFVGGFGNDVVMGGLGNDKLVGDLIFDMRWDFVVAVPSSAMNGGIEGNDFINGGKGDDTIYGGGGADIIIGGEGTDQLEGGSGDDTINANQGDDIISAGTGDDTVDGGAGTDTYYYRLGDGSDILIDYSSPYNSDALTELSSADTLVLENIGSSGVELERVIGTDDVRVRVLASNDTILLSQSYLSGSLRGVDKISFSDGVVWDRATIIYKSITMGTDVRDVIGGTSRDETFEGGKGDDYIDGGAGTDRYIYSSGDGDDIIREFASGNNDSANTELSPYDTLIFTDITSSGVSVTRQTGTENILISDNATGQTVTLLDSFLSGSQKGVDIVEFSDGVVWDRSTLISKAWTVGTESRDVIVGISQDEIFRGSKGDDDLNGLAGSDTYIYSQGDGNDIIREYTAVYNTAGSPSDTLKLTDINASGIEVAAIDGLDILLTVLATSETITLKDSNRNNLTNGVDRIEFADGTVWDHATLQYWAREGSAYYRGTTGADIIVGSHKNQRLEGNSGNDTIDGKGGSDVIFGEMGNDTIIISQSSAGESDSIDGGDGTDTLSLESFSSAVSVDLVSNGGEVLTSDSSTFGVGVSRSIASVSLVENVTGTGFVDLISGNGLANVLIGGDGSDTLDGRDGNDNIVGGSGSDLIIGGLGNDTMTGGLGDDVYYVDAGGDVVIENAEEGLDSVFSSVSRALGSNFEVLTLTGGAAINGTGNGLNNKVTGNAASNILDGGIGADVLVGQGGNDTYVIDNEADVTIEEAAGGIDTVQANVSWTLAAETENLSLMGTTALNGTGNTVANTLTGNSAANTLIGLAGNDTISAGGGNDILSGGTGADTLTGGANSDSFVFAAGDTGQATGAIDVITDFAKGSVGTGDKFDFTSAMAIGGSAATATATQAAINVTTGIATFATSSGTTLADALADIATRFSAEGDAAGEFALFRVNASGAYHLFVSDGVAGVTANDVVVQLTGVTAVGAINITAGDLGILT